MLNLISFYQYKILDLNQDSIEVFKINFHFIAKTQSIRLPETEQLTGTFLKEN